MRLFLALSIIVAAPLAAQSTTPSPPNDTAAIEAVVEDSGRKAVGVRIVADTAWVRIVDRRAPADIPGDGKTTSGTALRTSEIRVERRRGRWTVSKPSAAQVQLTPADSATLKAMAALRDPGRDTTVAPEIKIHGGDTVEVVVTYPNVDARYWARRSATPTGWAFDNVSMVMINHHTQAPSTSAWKKDSVRRAAAMKPDTFTIRILDGPGGATVDTIRSKRKP